MASISYSTKLRTLQEALRASVALAGVQVDVRAQAIQEGIKPWVELFLIRDEREPTTLGRGVASPYQVAVVILCRVVAPGVDILASMEARDAAVDSVVEAIREMKAGTAYDLSGLAVGDIEFNDYEGQGGGIYSQALINLSWLTTG